LAIVNIVLAAIVAAVGVVQVVQMFGAMFGAKWGVAKTPCMLAREDKEAVRNYPLLT